MQNVSSSGRQCRGLDGAPSLSGPSAERRTFNRRPVAHSGFEWTELWRSRGTFLPCLLHASHSSPVPCNYKRIFMHIKSSSMSSGEQGGRVGVHAHQVEQQWYQPPQVVSASPGGISLPRWYMAPCVTLPISWWVFQAQLTPLLLSNLKTCLAEFESKPCLSPPLLSVHGSPTRGVRCLPKLELIR
jgi:hypothetical protein